MLCMAAYLNTVLCISVGGISIPYTLWGKIAMYWGIGLGKALHTLKLSTFLWKFWKSMYLFHRFICPPPLWNHSGGEFYYWSHLVMLYPSSNLSYPYLYPYYIHCCEVPVISDIFISMTLTDIEISCGSMTLIDIDMSVCGWACSSKPAIRLQKPELSGVMQ